jgi:hypothetical protein
MSQGAGNIGQLAKKLAATGMEPANLQGQTS